MNETDNISEQIKKENPSDAESQPQKAEVNEPQNSEAETFLPDKGASQNENASRVDEMTAQKVQKIRTMMQSGMITPLQGQNLMNYVLKRAYESLLQKNGKSETAAPAEVQQNTFDINQSVSQFNKTNPEFFSEQGREAILDYLKSSGAKVDSEELSQISKLVEAIEKSAIERYLQKAAWEENLTKENEVAKQKLTANAQNSNGSDKKNRVFTREQIGKMSGADFTKNENLIMEQLKKGLIR